MAELSVRDERMASTAEVAKEGAEVEGEPLKSGEVRRVRSKEGRTEGAIAARACTGADE